MPTLDKRGAEKALKALRYEIEALDVSSATAALLGRLLEDVENEIDALEPEGD